MLGLFQDADIAGDLKDSKSTSGGKPHICSNKLDMQEANSCVTQQHGSRNYLIRRWSKIGGIPGLNLWDMVIDVLEPLAGRDPMRNIKPQNTKISHVGTRG